jgi:hypothetical protein
VLTVRDLLAADPAALTRAAQAWRRLARRLAGPTADLDRQVDAVRAGWTGPASEAATRQLAGVCAELDDAYPVLLGIGQVLAEHADTLARTQRTAVDVRAYAGCFRVRIGPDGTAVVDFTGEQPDPGDTAAAEQITGDLHRALGLAARSDAASVARLAELGPAGPTEPPGPPPPDRTPSHVATWWHGLSAAQRRWLVEHRSDLVGNLDGVPAADRDPANRERLAALLADPYARHRAALLAIQAQLDADGPGGIRTYLLGLSSDGSGRAIVAFGDPDTADHVVTCIPGLGGRLDRVAEELTRMGHLSAAAARTAPDRSTSVIAWLGYDAPDSLPQAASSQRAVGAGPALHRFLTGLRSTHQGTDSHNTVIGLSYGSTVVGLTGHGLGLAADDVILIGSPGTGVQHASDLGVAPGHVWASTARHDIINAAADPRYLRPDLPGPLRPIFGEHTDHLWFGPSPASPDFGAHVFQSAPGHATDPVGAHVGYYDEGNPALADLADIVVGDLGAVP